MRRPTSALAKLIIGGTLAATAVLAQQAPSLIPSAPDGATANESAATTATPSDVISPMLAARGARSLLRNGLDYITYQEYERALAFFREAEARKGDLSESERLKLKQGIERAQRGLREAANGINADRAYARSGGGRRPGAMALAAPEAIEREPIQLAGGQASETSNPNAANVRAAAPPASASEPEPRPTPDPLATSSPMPMPPTPIIEPVVLPPLSGEATPALLPGSAITPAPAPAAKPDQGVAPTSRPTAALPAQAASLLDPAAPTPDDGLLPSLPPNMPSPVVAPPDPVEPPGRPVSGTPEVEMLPPLPQLSRPSSPAPALAPAPVTTPAAALIVVPEPEAPPAPEAPPVGRQTVREQPIESLPRIHPGQPAAVISDTPPAPTVEPYPSVNPDISTTTPRGRFGLDTLVPERAEAPPSTLSPELQREVERIARLQDEEMRRNAATPPEPPVDLPSTPGGPTSNRLEISRAPSPTEARPIRAIPVPEEFVPLPKREWDPNRKYWAAAATCHMPLYFQDASLERYGYSMEQRFGTAGRYLSVPIDDPRQSKQRNQIIQPLFSIGLFATQIALLPYNILMDPPWEAEYDLGYYRPGDRVPTDVYYLPMTGVGPPLHGKNYGVAPSTSRW